MVDAIVSASVELRGFKMVEKRFESFTAGAVQVGVKTIYDLVWKWRNILATYPPPYAGEPPMEWVSEKQRRFVLWAIRTGKIKVPYHRTGAYGWNWRVKRDRSVAASEGVVYQLYNTVKYSKFVGGGITEAEPQAPIHRTRWVALLNALDALRQEIPNTIQSEIALTARRTGLSG